ncbi:MAG: hypothetical protein KDD19_11055 [Phaeodactylibacter sp.]|nr:hypothetical protein [Phaeodactylibacter sp.]MCB9053872.1 hypothetical protein [Lewinellaceae bacterium]
MSHNANKWEADIRQAVETHEFGYDPEAWAAMERLLDGAGGGVVGASPPTGAPGRSRGWKWLVVLLLGAAGLLLWWFWPAKPMAPPPLPRMETPVPPDKPSQPGEPAVPEEQPFVPEMKTLPRPGELLAPEKRQRPLMPALPDKEIPFLPLPLQEEQPRPRWAVPPSLPSRPPALLERPDTLPPELELLLPKPGKRRRDRKTLFPDVIEKY